MEKKDKKTTGLPVIIGGTGHGKEAIRILDALNRTKDIPMPIIPIDHAPILFNKDTANKITQEGMEALREANQMFHRLTLTFPDEPFDPEEELVKVLKDEIEKRDEDEND